MWGLGLAVAGCGSAERPPTLGDTPGLVRPIGDAAGATPTFQLDGAAVVPTCNLGPEGGVCACADQPLVLDTPNLYFVLDRSGSMNESSKWINVQAALTSLLVALGPRARVGAAVFPDPNDDGCTPGSEVFAPRRGDAPAGIRGLTAQAFASTLGHIRASGGTPTAETLVSLLPHLRALHEKTYVVLATDGGPNCNAGASCSVDQCTSNIDGNPSCAPGGPVNCCADPNLGGALACLDAAPTTDAVAALATAGMPVYVVGVPGSAPYASLLDELAMAGGTARGSEPQYYAIGSADQADLLAALSSIAAKITGTCTLTLNAAPPDPGLVNVFFDEVPLPETGPDGWKLDGTTVTVQGASCAKILGGAVLDVRVVAGCPTVMY